MGKVALYGFAVERNPSKRRSREPRLDALPLALPYGRAR